MELSGKSFYCHAVQSMIDSESDLLITNNIPENIRMLVTKLIENAKKEIVIACDDLFGDSLYKSREVYCALVDAAHRGIKVTIHSNTNDLSLTQIHDIALRILGKIKDNLEFIVVDRKMFRMHSDDINGTACVNSPDLAEILLSLLKPTKKETNLLDIDYEWL